MKKLLSILISAVFLFLLHANGVSAGGTFYCNPDPVSGGCVSNCTNGDVSNCTADPSGTAACLGPYSATACIKNPNPPQTGSCPGVCVEVASCVGVISGYSGKCGAGKECCQSKIGGGGNTSTSLVTCSDGKGINTAIGCIPFNDQNALIGFILRWAIGIGGGIAFILILVAGFQIITSQGDPKRLQAGQELLTSAIGGLILLIFSVFVLRVIGVDILRITQIGTQ